MKFTVNMKCPDALEEAIRDAVKVEVNELNLQDAEEQESIEDARYEKVRRLCVDKWFEWGEYIRVEVDTDAQTCVVVNN